MTKSACAVLRLPSDCVWQVLVLEEVRLVVGGAMGASPSLMLAALRIKVAPSWISMLPPAARASKGGPGTAKTFGP